MGRYYNGDIEGKFWFAVQSSSAADRFGVEGTFTFLDYYFDKSDLPKVKEELRKIKETIGSDNIKKIDDFFKNNQSYNDKIMEDYGLDVEMWNKNKKDYADYILGNKIKNQLESEGSCCFSAEL